MLPDRPTWPRTSRLRDRFTSLLDVMQCREEVLEGYGYRGGRLGISGWRTTTARCASARIRRPRRWTSTAGARGRQLYVVDSSFFDSSSAVNPTLTIVANALWVADHLADRLGVWVPAASAMVS